MAISKIPSRKENFSEWYNQLMRKAELAEVVKQGATTRCIPSEEEGGKGPCTMCGEEANPKAYFGRAY